MAVLTKIWAVEEKEKGGWKTIAIPVYEPSADDYLNALKETLPDFDPGNYRKIAYKRTANSGDREMAGAVE